LIVAHVGLLRTWAIGPSSPNLLSFGYFFYELHTFFLYLGV